jgi:hypothetical protein
VRWLDARRHLEVLPQHACLLIQHLNRRLPAGRRHDQCNACLVGLWCDALQVCKGVLELLCCGPEGWRCGEVRLVVLLALGFGSGCWPGCEGHVPAVLAADLHVEMHRSIGNRSRGAVAVRQCLQAILEQALITGDCAVLRMEACACK